jgi:hypothetical protein
MRSKAKPGEVTDTETVALAKVSKSYHATRERAAATEPLGELA